VYLVNKNYKSESNFDRSVFDDANIRHRQNASRLIIAY